MKIRARSDGQGSPLTETLHRSLNSYVLAAGAAGVSLLALAEPSAAEIIYTKTHHLIGKNGSYNLEFTNDGTTDLTIRNKYYHNCSTIFGSCTTNASLAAILPGANEVVYNVYGAIAMKPGMLIGANDSFKGATEKMAYGNPRLAFPSGSWINVSNRYLGVKFSINGEAHCGWARLSVQIQLPVTITTILTGYAYETTPNKPIIAGQTKGTDDAESADGAAMTLGRLALGKNSGH